MLDDYIAQTQRLLNDEQANFYNVVDLQAYVNIGRNTIAMQAECLIANATLSTISGQQSYGMTGVAPPSAALAAAINVRSIRSIISGVGAMLDARPWAWFLAYQLTGVNTGATGAPTVWSMQSQGSLGTLWFSPTPASTVILSVEAAWVPVPLTSDATPEALAYPWTAAVPYFAAYLGYVNAQRATDAQKMLMLFNVFMKAARVGVTPEVTPPTWPNAKGFQAAFDPQASNLPGARPAQGGEGALG